MHFFKYNLTLFVYSYQALRVGRVNSDYTRTTFRDRFCQHSYLADIFIKFNELKLIINENYRIHILLMILVEFTAKRGCITANEDTAG